MYKLLIGLVFLGFIGWITFKDGGMTGPHAKKGYEESKKIEAEAATGKVQKDQSKNPSLLQVDQSQSTTATETTKQLTSK